MNNIDIVLSDYWSILSKAINYSIKVFLVETNTFFASSIDYFVFLIDSTISGYDFGNSYLFP